MPLVIQKSVVKNYTRACAYQGARNVSFSENFTYLLNE